MPRYVVLQHEPEPSGGKPLHWDFMLEWEDVLRTWALNAEPEPNRMIDAEQLADHRLAYLQYQGPVSKNRGTVRQWDTGTYTVHSHDESGLCVHVEGHELRGEVTLRRLPTDGQRWIFTFSPSSSTSDR